MLGTVDPAKGGSLHDYRRQAATYDRTRGASPSILGPLERALEGAPGRGILDVCGGTGNYARALLARGWRPVVADLADAMLARARSKGLRCVRGDAARLPFASAAVDAVTIVSALHLIRAWREALVEARRVLRPGGRLALMAYTRENLGVHWVFDYFPRFRARQRREHQSLAEIIAELPGATYEAFEFSDLEDASGAALCRRPGLLLDPGYRAQTSFFERVAAEDPGQYAEGIARLERDLAAGRRPDREVAGLRARVGDGTVVSWRAA